ncbi:hypothetical protein ACHWQZ_G004104 [Mnemiopsis leidyi]
MGSLVETVTITPPVRNTETNPIIDTSLENLFYQEYEVYMQMRNGSMATQRWEEPGNSSTIMDHPCEESDTRNLFYCGSSQDSSYATAIVVKPKRDGDQLLEVAEINILGREDLEEIISWEVEMEKLDFIGPDEVITFEMGRRPDTYVLVLREKVQYFTSETFQLDHSLLMNFKQMENDLGLFESHQVNLILHVDSGIMLEGCRSDRIINFTNTESVCNGTKTIHQYNTWVFQFNDAFIRISCDGVTMLEANWQDLCDEYSEDYTFFHFSQELVNTDSLIIGPASSIMSVERHNLEFYSHNQGDEKDLKKVCYDRELDILEKCQHEYLLFDGGAGDHTDFLHQKIMEEFYSSANYQALINKIKQEVQKEDEENYLASEEYPLHLEEMFDIYINSLEGAEQLKQKKNEMVREAQKTANDDKYKAIKSRYAQARKFYGKMLAIIVGEIRGTYENSFDITNLITLLGELNENIMPKPTEPSSEASTPLTEYPTQEHSTPMQNYEIILKSSTDVPEASETNWEVIEQFIMKYELPVTEEDLEEYVDDTFYFDYNAGPRFQF